MTPRGVADVHVYTPERVELRYGVRPDQVPDFIGLKGDSSDNIPGVPGIGDKTAGQLIAQYGSLEDVIAHADELSPARRKNITEFADQARASKELATMRRDLEIDFDPAQIVLEPPDRSQLREIFRRFEFRGAPEPGRRARGRDPVRGAPARSPARSCPGGRASCRSRVAGSGSRSPTAASRSRRRTASSSETGTRLSGAAPRRPARRARLQVAAAADDATGRRHADRGVPDRAGPLRVQDRGPAARVRPRGDPRAGDRGGDGGARHARRGGAAPRRPDARAAGRARLGAALRRDRAAAHRRPRRDGGRGREDRHVSHGRDHGSPRRPRRGARGEGDTSWRARSSCSARPSRWRASCSRSCS